MKAEVRYAEVFLWEISGLGLYPHACGNRTYCSKYSVRVWSGQHGNRRFYRSCDHYQRCDRVSDSGWNSSVADEPCTQCAAFFGSFKDQRKTFYMENDRWNIVTFSLALYTAACGSYRWWLCTCSNFWRLYRRCRNGPCTACKINDRWNRDGRDADPALL